MPMVFRGYLIQELQVDIANLTPSSGALDHPETHNSDDDMIHYIISHTGEKFAIALKLARSSAAYSTMQPNIA